jgi:transposase-like protein
MAIASPEDSTAWCQQALTRGALAVYLYDEGTPVYQYRPIDRSRDIEESTRELYVRRGAGVYDPEDLRRDLLAGHSTVKELSQKYAISRTLIYTLRKKLLAPRVARVTVRHVIAPDVESAIIADIHTTQYTRRQIAARHGVVVNAIATVIKRHSLAGILPRYRGPRLPQGGRPQVYDYNIEKVLADLHDPALSRSEIAERNGIKMSTLYGIIQKHDMTRRRLNSQ